MTADSVREHAEFPPTVAPFRHKACFRALQTSDSALSTKSRLRDSPGYAELDVCRNQSLRVGHSQRLLQYGCAYLNPSELDRGEEAISWLLPLAIVFYTPRRYRIWKYHKALGTIIHSVA